jgi:zinc transport system ATP-binding protein
VSPGAPAGAAGPPLIEARGVGVRIGRHELLRAVDLELRPGQILSLIGPNGAGKTTLVRVLLGVLKPTSGQVLRRPGLIVGYVPQRLHLDPTLPLSVHHFLTLGRRRRPELPLAAALAEVGAGHLARALMSELSGGEFQRVTLARALLRRPDLLILDEPAQGVDFAGQLELYALIERVRNERSCGVLLVSHDLHVVMAATDQVICLNRHVCCAGQPEAVSRHPEYQSLFGAPAAARLAVYTHAHDHAHDLAGAVVEGDQPATDRAGEPEGRHRAR